MARVIYIHRLAVVDDDQLFEAFGTASQPFPRLLDAPAHHLCAGPSAVPGDECLLVIAERPAGLKIDHEIVFGRRGVAAELPHAQRNSLQPFAGRRGYRDLAYECLNDLGVVARRLSLIDDAKNCHAQAFRMAEESGNLLKIEKSKSYIGRLAAHPLILKLLDAEKYLRDASKIARQIHNRRGFRIEHTRLIDVLILAEKYDEAWKFLEQSERLNLEDGDRIGEAWNLKHRGQLEKARGNLGPGMALIRQGIEQLRELKLGDEERLPEFEAALVQ